MSDPYWTSRKNRLELIDLSSINKVILVRKNSLEQIELSSISKVSLVY